MKDIVPKKTKERVVKKVSKSDFLNRPRQKTTKTTKATKTSPKSTAGKIKKSYAYKPLSTTIEEDSSRFGIWAVAFFSVVILFFALSFLFKGAKITVTPRIVELTLDETMVAFRDGEEGQLSFDVVSLSGEESTTILSSEKKELTRNATGRVIIYNNFSSKPQNLLIETRLETPDGKIYKTDEKLTVPGQTTENGEKIPGSIEVGVTADQPGEEYNIDYADFTITGFKGGPKYDKFYARSVDNISGGKIGELYTLSAEAGQVALEELRGVLISKLAGDIFNQLPSGFIMFPGATIYEEKQEVEFFESEDPDVPITEEGELHAFIFNEKQLAQKIAEAVVSEYDGASVIVPNIDQMGLTINNKEQISPEEDKISFTLSGDTKIVWAIDENELKESLTSRRKKEFQKILSKFEYIESAEVVLKPFWSRTFPEKIKDIKLINTADNR